MDYFFTCKKCNLKKYCQIEFGQKFDFICSACGSFNHAIAQNIEFKDLPEEEQLNRLKQITKGYKEI